MNLYYKRKWKKLCNLNTKNIYIIITFAGLPVFFIIVNSCGIKKVFVHQNNRPNKSVYCMLVYMIGGGYFPSGLPTKRLPYAKWSREGRGYYNPPPPSIWQIQKNNISPPIQGGGIERTEMIIPTTPNPQTEHPTYLYDKKRSVRACITKRPFLWLSCVG